MTKQGLGTLTLTGANTYSGLTTVKQGTLELGANAFEAVLHTSTSGLGADIQGGQLVFDYSAGSDPVTTVRSNLRTSFVAGGGGGTLNSGPMYTSTGSVHGYGLSYVDDATAHTVTVQQALYGDATLDGGVTVEDLTKLLSNLGQSNAVWTQGDFNYDGSVTVEDLTLLLSHLGQTIPALDVSGYSLNGQEIGALNAAGIKIIPEPGTVALLLGGLLGMFAYAWRKRK